MLVKRKDIGGMFLALYREDDRGCIVVGNLNKPDNIIRSTGFHHEFDLVFETYEGINTTKEVHGYFDD